MEIPGQFSVEIDSRAFKPRQLGGKPIHGGPLALSRLQRTAQLILKSWLCTMHSLQGYVGYGDSALFHPQDDKESMCK
jgi:hypothetical protein